MEGASFSKIVGVIIGVFFVVFFWLQRKNKLAFLVISVVVFEDCDDL